MKIYIYITYNLRISQAPLGLEQYYPFLNYKNKIADNNANNMKG